MLAGRKQCPNPLRRQPPLRDQAVGRKKSLQWRRGYAVLIDVVATRDSAEAFEIEIGVLDLQRIEGPLQQLVTLCDSVFALEQLNAPAEAPVSVPSFDRQHVRVQIGMSTANARNRKREAHEHFALPCADNLTANLRRQRENTEWHQFVISEPPHFLLQRDACAEFFQFGAVTQLDGVCRHGFSRFDSCHSDSISSSDASAGSRPRRRSLSSRYSKRRRNLRFVLRRADSGSSER